MKDTHKLVLKIFARHSIPLEVRSDDGACYSSTELKKKSDFFSIYDQLKWTSRNIRQNRERDSELSLEMKIDILEF